MYKVSLDVISRGLAAVLLMLMQWTVTSEKFRWQLNFWIFSHWLTQSPNDYIHKGLVPNTVLSSYCLLTGKDDRPPK